MTRMMISLTTRLCASVLFATACAASPAQNPLTPVESTMVRSVDAQIPSALALLERLVDINSGTMNLPGVVEVKDVLAPMFLSLGFTVHWVPMDEAHRAGDLVAEHRCPLGDGACGKRLLLIGHMDTVFEKDSTFQTYALVPGNDNNVATGPGVNDMKGGLVVMLVALKAMQSAGVLDTAEIRIVLSGDEERHGEPLTLTRRDMLEAAHASDLALEFEPGMRVNGVDTIGITRRSSISWHLDTTGRSGHSSQIFTEKLGYGAIYEITRILDSFCTQLREPGLTFNVGLLLGGATASLNETRVGGAATGKANVIAPTAIALGDIRTLDNAQTDRVEQKMRTIVEKHLPRTGATLSFEDGYPPMSATDAGHDLFRQFNAVNLALGLAPMQETDPMLRGAGDISFVAPILPGLVGVGPMGEGMHAEGEIVLLDSIPKQAKRDALLMYRLSQK